MFHVKHVKPPAILGDNRPMNSGTTQTAPPKPSLAAPLALTVGDPAGIGPEILLLTMARRSPEQRQRIRVFGSPLALRRAHQQLGLQEALPRLVPNLDGGSDLDCPQGQLSAAAGRMGREALAAAVRACLDHECSGLVTGPIHKQAWRLAGYTEPGHTEVLQAMAAQHLGLAQLPVRMMLTSPSLTVVLDSIHVPLRQALADLSPTHIAETILLAHRFAPAVLGLPQPRMALAGLNPHASDGGLFGSEEDTILEPALAIARGQGVSISGPHSPDTVFFRARRQDREFDLVVCLYHDQGLIPIKLFGLDEGINITLGLPFLRTSVDHGTAFDLAGKGKASAASLEAALALAEARCFT